MVWSHTDMVWSLVAFGLIVTVGATPFRWRRTAAGREKSLDRYARRVNLALHPAVNALIMRRLVLRDRATLIGGFGGTALVVSGYLIADPSDSWPFAALYAMAGITAGIAVAVAIGSVVFRVTNSADAPRYARVRVPVASDYTSPVLLWLMRGSVLALVLFWLAFEVIIPSTAATTGGFSRPWIAVAVAATVIAQLGAELAIRAILRSGQRASSPLELAWDDALRGQTFSDVLTVTPIIAVLASLAISFGYAASMSSMSTFNIVMPISILFLVVLMALVRGSETRFWTHLWAPELSYGVPVPEVR